MLTQSKYRTHAQIIARSMQAMQMTAECMGYVLYRGLVRFTIWPD